MSARAHSITRLPSRPTHRFWSVCARCASGSRVDILVGLIILGIALSRLEGQIGLWQALAFGVTLFLGGLMIYCFWLMLTTGAFWVVRMEEIVELFQGVYQAGRWPVSIYPGWLRLRLDLPGADRLCCHRPF